MKIKVQTLKHFRNLWAGIHPITPIWLAGEMLLISLLLTLLPLTPLAAQGLPPKASSPALPSASPESASPESASAPLTPLVDPPSSLGLDSQIWGQDGFPRDWSALMRSVNHSLTYLHSPKSHGDYAKLEYTKLNYANLNDRLGQSALGITHDRVLRSVQRFRQLLLAATSPQALQQQVQAEFDFYRAVGGNSTTGNGTGSVHFTGYFEPTYPASREPNDRFCYPLYRRPPDFAAWPEPHPTRLALEGRDGLQGSQGLLAGLELVWLANRLEAYLVQVQGSARLSLPDGSVMSVGYDGHTNYPYVSVGKALVTDGHFAAAELTLPKVLQYFTDRPEDLNHYLPQNDRFVFFRETSGTSATGSIGVPVTPERSIATDKSLMPPGAVVLMVLDLPYARTDGSSGYALRSVQRYGVDQDTGGAIRGAGRADIFMGTGTIAGDRAGLVNSQGELYYLLLKD